nr:RNA-directed DNA polymerase, eukaryota, reverse transcriptase zinc-binding domain protein [Tanacetum cinerariifolium]
MVAEALQISILEACSKGLYKGVYLSNNGANISLLQYADDALFFGDWSRLNVIHLIYILKCFELASGLKVNISKSRIWVSEFLPVRWDVVINRFRERLSSWKANTLSIGGRLTLVKAGLKDSHQGICWVKWDTILDNIKSEGLCVGCLVAKNLSLLGKWNWRFYIDKIARWYHVIREFYGEDGGFSSPMNLLGVGGCDPWCGSRQRLMDIFPRLFALNSDKDCKLRPTDIDKWTWSGDVSGVFRVRSLSKNIDNILLSNSRRKIWSWWNLDSPWAFPLFSITDISMGNVKTGGCSRTNKALNRVLHCAIWSIWNWRNQVSYADTDSVSKIIDEDIFPAIQRMSKLWMLARIKSPNASWNSWISRPFDIFC